MDQTLKGGIYLYGQDTLSGKFFSRGINIGAGQTEVELDLLEVAGGFLLVGKGTMSWKGITVAYAGLGAPITISETTVLLNFSKDHCLENNIFAGTDCA